MWTAVYFHIHTHTHTHTHTHARIHQVILYFSESNPLGPLLQKRVRDTDYPVSLLHSQERVVEECLLSRHPALIVVSTEHKSSDGLETVEQLSRYSI